MGMTEDLARIALQERTLRFDRFDEDTAWALGSRLRTWGIERAAPIVIDIRTIGRPLFYVALAGSTPDNPDWARRKRNVVERYHRSSYAIGLELAMKGSTLEARYGLSLVDYAAHGGAVPIATTASGVIGSVTISGLSQREDHALVVRGLCAILGRDADEFALLPVD